MDNVDLNSNISAQSSVTSQTPAFEQPVSKKRLSPLVIILSIVVLVLAGAAVVLFFMLPKQEDTPTTQNQQQQQTELMDVSEYTDIVLVDYDGLEVTISEGNESDEIFPGIVKYFRTLDEGVETMTIVNKKILTDEQNDKYFTSEYNDILNDNIEAEWLTKSAEPWSMITVLAGTPVFDLLSIIEDVQYPNTDHTLAILSLSHGQEYAQADSTSPNYQIFVFALNGDNIIRLSSERSNLIQDLLLSEEESTSCSEEIPDYYTSYDVECLEEIYSSGKYDELLQTKANELVSSFAIAN